jgi:hypothetical protein
MIADIEPGPITVEPEFSVILTTRCETIQLTHTMFITVGTRDIPE